MADVLFVCVRDDVPRADALAEAFDAVGFAISDETSSDITMYSSGACVVIWSPEASRSGAFLSSAQRAMQTGNAVIVSFSADAPPPSTEATPVFDLSHWQNDSEDPALDPVFYAVDRLVTAARAVRAVAALAEQTVKALSDAEISASERDEPALTDDAIAHPAWSAQVPMRRPSRAGESARRDDSLFTHRVGGAARALAVVAACGLVVFASGFALLKGGAESQQSAVVALPSAEPQSAGIGLAELAIGGPAFELAEPVGNEAPVGVRGFEPPSADTVRRVDSAPRRARARSATRDTRADASGAASVVPTALTDASDGGDRRLKPRPKPEDHA